VRKIKHSNRHPKITQSLGVGSVKPRPFCRNLLASTWAGTMEHRKHAYTVTRVSISCASGIISYFG